MIINAGIVTVIVKADYNDKLATDILKEAGVTVCQL
jgi:deoxycytidylate deaminase